MFPERQRAAPGARQLSAIPGRVRWHVEALVGTPTLARQVEAHLGAQPGVHEVIANSFTGRVLVRSAPDVPVAVMTDHLTAVLSSSEMRRDAGAGGRRGNPTSIGIDLEDAASVLARALSARLGRIVRIGAAAYAAYDAGSRRVATPFSSGHLRDRPAAGTRGGQDVPPSPDGQAGGDSDLHALIRAVAPHGARLGRATALSAAGALAGIARFVALGGGVDSLFGRRSAWLPDRLPLSRGALIVSFGGVSLFLSVAMTWCRYQLLMEWRNTGRDVQHQLRGELYAHVQRIEMFHLQERQRSNLLGVLSRDLDRIESAFDGGAELADIAVRSVLLSAAILHIAPSVGLIGLVPLPLMFLLTYWLYPPLRERFSQLRDAAAELSAEVASNLAGMTTVKSFTLEDDEQRRLLATSRRYRQRSLEAAQRATAFPLALEVVIFSSLVLTSLAGSRATAAGKLGVGSYTTLLMLVGQLFYPLTRLGPPLESFQHGITSFARARRLLSLSVECDADGSQGLDVGSVRGDVQFESVSFRYPNGDTIFRELTLHARPGQITTLIGPSGAGKSTVVNLLLRFFAIDAGRILLDGRDIREFRRRDLRKAVSIVSQDVFLFPRTVLENIRIGAPGATEAAVIAAAKVADAHEFISALPNGYHTQVGDRGEKLSGGQRQRLALARAILKDAPILVLDEATSSVDVQMEETIYRSIHERRGGKTVIIITHRAAALRYADHVYVLDRGAVVAQGLPVDMMEYARSLTASTLSDSVDPGIFTRT